MGGGGAYEATKTVPGLGTVGRGLGRGLEPAEHVAKTVVRHLGQQACNYAQGVGQLILVVAAFEVEVKGHEGMEAEAVVGNAPDKGMNFGGGPMVGDFGSPMEGEVLGQGEQPDYGQFDGEFALQGVDTTANLG